MRQDENDPLPRRLDPQTPAREPCMSEGRGLEIRSARAISALPHPTQDAESVAREGASDPLRSEEALGPEPLPGQRQHLFGSDEEPGVADQKTARARVAILRHAAQERRLATQAQAQLGCELDLAPVVEPAFDDRFRRRARGQCAERSEAQRLGDVGIQEVGQAPARDALRRQPPEDVAEVAIDGEGTARGVSLRPEALGEEKVGEIRAVGETPSQPQAERHPGDDSRAMAQEILEGTTRTSPLRGREDLAQRDLERQQPSAVQYQCQRRHPRFGERGGVEARTRLQALAADPETSGVAEADLLRVGQHDLYRAHRCARAGEPVEVGGELFSLRLTVGH